MMKPLKEWKPEDVKTFLKNVDKKTWLIVLSCAVGLLVTVVFLVIPAWFERPSLRRDIQAMEAQIRQVATLNQKRQGWDENQKVYGPFIEKVQKRVFTDESIGVLLGQFSRMARESRVDVLASKPFSEKTVFQAPFYLKYQPVGYEFTVQGGYHDLGSLISRIETHEKLLRVQSIEITPSEKDSGRQLASVKIWAISKPSQAAMPAAGAVNAKR